MKIRAIISVLIFAYAIVGFAQTVDKDGFEVHKTKEGIEYRVIPNGSEYDDINFDEPVEHTSNDTIYNEEVNEQDSYFDDFEYIYPSSSKSDYINPSTKYKERYTGSEYLYKEPDEPKPKEESIELPSLNFGPALQVIFWIFCGLAIVLIAFLLFKFFSNLDLKNEPKLKPTTFKEAESELDEKVEIDQNDLSVQIADAKANGNYRLVTRFYFLLYLQKLQEKDLIRYHQDKTNADYLAEIKNDNTSSQFVKVSHLFEYVWYGHKSIDIESFNMIESTFNEQIKNIG